MHDNYFISTFDDINGDSMYLPYANGHCTLTTNHNSPAFHFFACDGPLSFDCEYNGDDTCQQNASCLSNSGTTSFNTSTLSFNTLHYGRCSNDSSATNANYAQISFYTSSKSKTQCLQRLNTFGTVYIATNICVQQSDASYLMMTCDGAIARINSYIDNTCTRINDTTIEYTNKCNYYSNIGTDAIYSRLEGCYVDNIDQTPIVTDGNIHASEEELIKIPHTAHIINAIDNLELLYIVFIVLFVFYLLICVYIWCEERRKRTRVRLVNKVQQKYNEKFQKDEIAHNHHNGEVQNNIVVLDEEGHRQALINEGYIV